MIKNWAIIRDILIRLEATSTPNTALDANQFPEYPEQEVAYNMRLLSEAGYIKANILESKSGDGRIAAALARSLTNSGHELLDTIRNDTVWAKVQDTFKSKGMDMTFDLVIMLGKKIAENFLLS
ncbi:hypothetical protein BKP43_37760 [Variovorax boronicumulans]|uniref:DUF2513 domain-containing protein n=1 Tax=Variovorax boronicumulans TaxID=436515 RepID=UPI0015542E4B|nr:DUF2513 domain-containing protein [Variovorax boronicumulans]PBI87710.1 hypothetical protein BKP43_37760 [Variovorax boronicumulans]